MKLSGTRQSLARENAGTFVLAFCFLPCKVQTLTLWSAPHANPDSKGLNPTCASHPEPEPPTPRPPRRVKTHIAVSNARQKCQR